MGQAGRKQDRLEKGGRSSAGLSRVEIDGIRTRVAAGSPPELSYAAVVPLTHRQRHAQFFTPPKVAKLMAEWAITPATTTMLDPAVGMGVLVRAAMARKADIRVTAYERDPVILEAFLDVHPDPRAFLTFQTDFLTCDLASTYDAVLMNPPYLRHHDMSYDFDIFRSFGDELGLDISRLSNAYLLFTLKAAVALRPGGRAAVIIPAEWMNANFGAAMKRFLVGRRLLRELVYFSGCSGIFDDALTTASVLLLEKPAL